ncbi:MAG: hypothetical protein ACI9YH_000943 [Colwellia sp.]
MSTKFETFEQLFKDRKDYIKVAKKNDFQDGLLNLLTQLYPDNAHFIYELLQNAEDAQASEVHFLLSESSLKVEHNGKRQFSLDDVISITGLKSTKEDDVVKIGKFGVGFKAVFSYTASPRIFSDRFCFEIKNLFVPHKIENNYLEKNKTIFEFPFNKPEKLPQDAFLEIKKGLDALSIKALFFLQNIKTITWTVENKTASISKVNDDNQIIKDNYLSIKKKSRDGLNSLSHWLKYDRALEKHNGLFVSIVYKLDFKSKKTIKFNPKKELDEQFKIVIDPSSNVSVYFPAEKETSNLKFSINAPFASTVARDSIKDREENDELIHEIAILAAESLHLIKAQGLLTASFLEVLPNQDDNIPIFYQPIQNLIFKEFQTENIVPCQDNKHLISQNVYESPASFRHTFDIDDLKYFVSREEEDINWLVYTQGKRQKQFISDLQINKWDIEELYEFIDNVAGDDAVLYCEEEELQAFKSWFISKDIQWIKEFYCLLHKECDGEDDYGEQPIKGVNSFSILLTQDKELVCANECYFPTKLAQNDVYVLHKKFYPRKKDDVDIKVDKFFNLIGVNTYGDKEKISLILKECYDTDNKNLYFKEHISHLKLFINYYLNNKDDSDFFKSQNIIFTNVEKYSLPKDVYLTFDYTKFYSDTYFDYYFCLFSDSSTFGISELYLECGIEIDILSNFFKWLGCISDIKIIKSSTWFNPESSQLHKSYGKRTSYEDDVDYTINHLQEMLSQIDDFSVLLWQVLSKQYKRYFHAKAKYRSNKSEYYNYADSQLLYHLKANDWIPTINGQFLNPKEITRATIIPWYLEDKNIELWEDIQLFYNEDRENEQTDEKRIKAAELGFDTLEKLESAKWFNGLSVDERKRFKTDVENRKANEREFPNQTSRNPEHREAKVKEEGKIAPIKEKEVRERSVAINKNEVIEQAKEYLTDQYTDDDGIQWCQICEKELPFRKLKGGEYYFEASEYNKKIEKSIYQNYLCLCPNHSAMFKHANEYTGSLTDLLDLAANNRVEIKLAGEIEAICFTDKHLLDLQAVLCEVSSVNVDNHKMAEGHSRYIEEDLVSVSKEPIKVNNQYVVNWRTNIENLDPIIAFTIENLGHTIKDIKSSAFVITHQNWIDAGFSGCSTPSHILLDHTNENVASSDIMNLIELEEKVKFWEKDSPKVTHCAVETSYGVVSLCGTLNVNLANKISQVTCPFCKYEIFSKTTFKETH